MVRSLHLSRKMTRVAIPTWQGRVSPTLDFASKVLVADLGNAKYGARMELDLRGPHQHCLVRQLADLGIDVVICGAISRTLAESLEQRGIRVASFVSGGVEEVLWAFLHDTLGDRGPLGDPRTGARGRNCRRRRSGGKR